MGTEFIFDDERGRDSELGSGIRFVSLGPRVFQNLRSLHGVEENDLLGIFSVSNLLQKKLRVKLQSGKGGSFFVLPENGQGQYLIKSINAEEYEVTKTILGDLYMHFLNYPASFINAIYGCYALYLSETDEFEPQYFVLMKNVLDINRDQLPEKAEILCFDLKGSSAGRRTVPDPRKLVAPDIDPAIQKQTLKDEDFLLSFKKLDITPIQSKCILNQLEADAQFFAKYMLIDYSLLLFVLNVPYKSFSSTRTGTKHVEHEKAAFQHAHDLILGEKRDPTGKTEIIIEERDRGTATVYRVTNANDVATIKQIDDDFGTMEAAATRARRPSLKEAKSESKREEAKEMESGKLEPERQGPLGELKSIRPSKMRLSKEPEVKRSVINFPSVVMTDNIGKYTLGAGEQSFGREGKEDPFGEGKSPSKSEAKAAGTGGEEEKGSELPKENQILIRKTVTEKADANLRTDELGIAKTQAYEYRNDVIPENLFPAGGDHPVSLNPRTHIDGHGVARAGGTAGVRQPTGRVLQAAAAVWHHRLSHGIWFALSAVALHNAETPRAARKRCIPEQSLGGGAGRILGTFCQVHAPDLSGISNP